MNFIDMSISGASVIIAGVLIRKAGMNYFPKKLFAAIWWIAAFRLTIPFALPFPVNIYAITGRFIPVNTVHIQPVSTVEVRELGTEVSSRAFMEHGFSCGLVWRVGMVVCICYFVAVYIKGWRKFTKFEPADNDYTRRWLLRHKLLRNITIGCSEYISSPMTYGIFRPVILLPANTDWSDESTLEYVLEHEFIHIRHFDTMTKIIFTAILCIHWFNPFVWLMHILLNRDLELICDESVVSSFGEDGKSSYALCLIGMEENKDTCFTLFNNFKKNFMEERIGAIMKFRNKSISVLMMSAVLTLGVVILFGTSIRADNTYTVKNSIDYDAGESADGVYQPHEMWDNQELQNMYEELYGEYGLSWNKSDDRLYLDGRLVRFFIDNWSDEPGGFLGRLWTESTGEVNVHVIRDKNKEITGLEQITLAEAERLSGNVYKPTENVDYDGDYSIG